MHIHTRVLMPMHVCPESWNQSSYIQEWWKIN